MIRYSEPQSAHIAQDSLLAPVAIAGGAALFVTMLLLNYGGLIAILIVAGLVVLSLVTVQPRLALHVVIAFAMLADLHLTDPDRSTGTQLFKSLAPYGINFTPAELVLGFALLGLLIRLVFDDEVRSRPGAIFVPLALFMFGAAVGTAVGLARGPEMSVLRAETRGLLYLPILYLVATHFLTTRGHIERLVWTVIITGNIMAAENVYRYFTHFRGTANLTDLAFSHENALLCAAVIVVLLARVVWSGRVIGEWRSVLLMVLPMFALIVMRRRAGMVALDAGLIMLCVVLLRENIRLFLMVVPLAVLGVGLLLAMTWNSPGGSGTFARSFRAATGDQQTVSARDQASDNYRKIEEADIRLNIKNQPITGLGFGRTYAFYIPLPDLSAWQLWHYVPHNSVFWFWMKAGIAGFVGLAALFAASLCRSMQLMNVLRRDRLRPYAFAMGAWVLMFMLYSWVDLGLVTPRTLVFFGLVLGVIGALGYIKPDGDPAVPEAA